MCNAQFVIRSTPLIAKRRYSVRMKPEDTAILEYPARPDQPATASLAAARQVLHQAVAARAFPGAAFGVISRNQIAIDAVGRFTYDSNAPAVRPDTVFDIASVSKVVATTTAAMILYDRGLLDLDTRVGDILPGFVVGMEHGSGKDRVTLRMLLAHNSGLPGYVTFFREHTTPPGLFRAALRLPLEAQPGTRTEYSDPGYILLGKAVEILSGECLDTFCAREIFTPLRLGNTCFRPPAALRATIPPTEHDTTFRHRIIQGEVQDENAFVLGGIAGHAGVFSTVRDLLTLAQCILDQGRTASGAQLFTPETLQVFATRHSTPDGKERALGWDVPTPPSSSGRYFGPRSIGHLGYAGTSIWIDPDQSLAIVLLTNRTWPDRSSDAIRQVRPAFHDAVVEALQRAL